MTGVLLKQKPRYLRRANVERELREAIRLSGLRIKSYDDADMARLSEAVTQLVDEGKL